MRETSYYHCQHCREDVCYEITCPICGLGNQGSLTHLERENLFDDFFRWLKVHKAAREQLFTTMREKYDWGYIKACEVIQYELTKRLQEHKDASDRLERDKGLLDEQVPTRGHHALE